MWAQISQQFLMTDISKVLPENISNLMIGNLDLINLRLYKKTKKQNPPVFHFA